MKRNEKKDALPHTYMALWKRGTALTTVQPQRSRSNNNDNDNDNIFYHSSNNNNNNSNKTTTSALVMDVTDVIVKGSWV